MINIKNNTQTKVSICLTLHPDLEFTKKCLSSIYKQSLDEIEIICIITNENPKLNELLNNYSKKYNNIKIIKENDSHNLYDYITGEYIIPFNSRNWFNLIGLESAYDFATHNQLDVLLCSSTNYNQKTGKTYEEDYYLDNDITKLSSFSNEKFTKEIFEFTKNPYNLYKKSFLEKEKIEIPLETSFNNYYFYFKTLFTGLKVNVYKKPIFYNRNSDDETSILEYIIFNDFNIKDNIEKININSDGLSENIERIFRLFERLKIYEKHEYNLLNYIIALLKNIYYFDDSEENYKEIHDIIFKYSIKYYTSFQLNLKTDNLRFFRDMLESDNKTEIDLISFYQKMYMQNEIMNIYLNGTKKQIETLRNNDKFSIEEFKENIVESINNNTQNNLINQYKTEILESRNDILSNINKIDTEKRMLKYENTKIKEKRDEILSSTSWKLTNFFRKLGLFKTILILLIIIFALIIIFILILILMMIMLKYYI